jgi:hypothetical protein
MAALTPATLEDVMGVAGLGEAVLARLQPDELCVVACVSRRFKAAAYARALYARLDLRALAQPQRVTDSVLALLCARAGGALRFLDVTACDAVTEGGLVTALRSVDVMDVREAYTVPTLVWRWRAGMVSLLSLRRCHSVRAGCVYLQGAAGRA